MEKITLTNDGEIDLALGKSRKETSWKNTTSLWSDFVNKVRLPHHTEETYQQYISAKREYQDNKKDVGGYVGGFLTNGRRKTEAVLHRSLITLDMDFGKLEAWSDWQMLYGNACCVYSTHKHTPEKPRLRVVLPIDRPVSREEYEPIARKIAAQFGLDLFDETTYECARLMYWQSTSKDAKYFFDYCDGIWINADEILASYEDWKDASCWPMSDKVDKIIQHQIKKQVDPLEKEGVVGAFCRTYNIHETIETFLSEEYEACAIDNRYSYKKGSTSAGLVTYQDKFAFSHHGTDPTSGKLCNAFDLVRLHKFAIRDEDAAPACPINKLPSYQAMLEFATKDSSTRLTIARERSSSAAKDFEEAEVINLNDETNDEWKANLDTDKKGITKGTLANCELIFDNDLNLKGSIRYNAFNYIREVVGQLPWRIKGDLSNWKDADEANMRAYFEKEYEVANKSLINDALDIAFDKRQYHPVKEYLDNLPQWDGIERIKDILPDFLGVEDSKYTRTAFRKSLVACVARIYNPGCKFDYVLTLVGEEGKGKSTILSKLGGKWFSDNFSTPSGKESKEQLMGVWIVEIPELAGIRKADAEAIKSYLSIQHDRFRPAYGKNVINAPRQCVFFGTTNNIDFLKGSTGNRRFWPIMIRPDKITKRMYEEFTEELRSNLWAEAKHYFSKGERLWLGEELELEAKRHQEEHREADPWEEVISNYINALWPINYEDMSCLSRHDYISDNSDIKAKGEILRDKFSVMDIWREALGGLEERLDDRASKRIRAIMRQRRDFEEKPIWQEKEKKTYRGFLRLEALQK